MNHHSSNVIPQEIEKFANLANQWWDLNGPLKSLHDINPIRFKFIEQYINLNQKQVLDVGCGGGILTESIAQAGAFTTGIDLADDSIKVAKNHAQQLNLSIQYQNIDIEAFAKKQPEYFDVITCMELLEHVPEPERIIQACSQLSKKSGLIFMSTINKNLKSYFQAIIAAEYLLKLVPKKTHQHHQFIKPATLIRMARNHQLELIGISGFSYNLLTKQYFLTKNCDVNYLVVFIKI